MYTPQEWVYYAVGIALLIANVACWIGLFYKVPGNWILLGLNALGAGLLKETSSGLGISWGLVTVLAVLAGAGEFFAFANRRRAMQGRASSRRAVVMAIICGIGGAAAATTLQWQMIPLVGQILIPATIGAIGAYLGAAAGESWKSRTPSGSGRGRAWWLAAELMGNYAKNLSTALMAALASIGWFK